MQLQRQQGQEETRAQHRQSQMIHMCMMSMVSHMIMIGPSVMRHPTMHMALNMVNRGGGQEQRTNEDDGAVELDSSDDEDYGKKPAVG